jgi:hypothetical protein
MLSLAKRHELSLQLPFILEARNPRDGIEAEEVRAY